MDKLVFNFNKKTDNVLDDKKNRQLFLVGSVCFGLHEKVHYAPNLRSCEHYPKQAGKLGAHGWA